MEPRRLELQGKLMMYIDVSAISNPMERNKITLENVSVGDFTNPFLYNAILRSKTVNFDCVQSARHGEFEHGILRKG